jgi:Polyketide cyclase / dehydrase and lipid transport
VDEVFAYVSEVEHGPDYISSQREAHKTSSGPMGIGSTFATTGTFPRRSATFEVTDYELNQRLAWKAKSGSQTTTTWAFQPSGPSTRVTYTRVADAHGLSNVAESLLQRFANGQVDQDLGTLKELLAVTRSAPAKAW